MLAVVSCTCGGAENFARKTLKLAGCDYWLDVPIYKGKDNVDRFIETLPANLQKCREAEALKYLANRASSYVVIAGYDNEKLVCSDIKNGDVKSKLDADVIIRAFA